MCNRYQQIPDLHESTHFPLNYLLNCLMNYLKKWTLSIKNGSPGLTIFLLDCSLVKLVSFSVVLRNTCFEIIFLKFLKYEIWIIILQIMKDSRDFFVRLRFRLNLLSAEPLHFPVMRQWSFDLKTCLLYLIL